MKKIIAIALMICILSSFAYADLDEKTLITYNACALVLGAPQLKGECKSENDYVLYQINSLLIGFELSPTGNIRSGFIYSDDDTNSADFLCSGMAMISFLGETDMTAFGMLLMQYVRTRSGQDSVPYTLGMDQFQVVNSNAAKYSFIYMNNDNKTK